MVTALAICPFRSLGAPIIARSEPLPIINWMGSSVKNIPTACFRNYHVRSANGNG